MANSTLPRWLLVLLPVFAGACAPGEPSQTELDDYLCAPETLGEDFQELVRGEFTPRDLAALSDGADVREDAYREAGMVDGKFVYFKSVLPKPPFDPPLNVVCQVLEFETQTAAAEWVRDLPVTDAMEVLAFGRVPREQSNEWEEARPPALGQPEVPMRRFAVSGGAGEERTTVHYLVGAEGRFVRIVSLGRRGMFDNDTPEAFLRRLWINRGPE